MDHVVTSTQRTLTLVVNGQPRTLLVEPRTHLADALREHLNLSGTHLGCEQGVCGACTVLIDDIPQRSCIAYAVDCEGSRITTIEGFDDDATMAELRADFAKYHALQCGYCTPGMLITARDIVLRLGDIPEPRIREELAGNLCRCTGYVGIVNAVRSVATGRTPQPAVAAIPVKQRSAPTAMAAVVTAVSAPPASTPASGAAMLEERVHLAASPDAAWAVLADLDRVAGCLPGAQLDTRDGDRVTGRVTMALGLVKLSLAGEGTVTLNAASRSGRLIGRGRDGHSRAQGEISWNVVVAEAGGSDILVQLSWRLTGPLAQFGRGALVQDVARRLARDFARNLDAMVAGQALPAARPPSLFAVLWAALKARLFGR